MESCYFSPTQNPPSSFQELVPDPGESCNHQFGSKAQARAFSTPLAEAVLLYRKNATFVELGKEMIRGCRSRLVKAPSFGIRCGWCHHLAEPTVCW